MIRRIEIIRPVRPPRPPTQKRSNVVWRGSQALPICGAALLVGYVALFLLMQSRSVWEVSALIPESFGTIFAAIRDLSPQAWTEAVRWSEAGADNTWRYALIMAWLFAVYFYVLWRAYKREAFRPGEGKRALRTILGFTAIALLALLFARGMFSADVYSYAWYGRILGLHGDNPYVFTPVHYERLDQSSEWFQNLYWKNLPAVYGPVWLALAGGIAQVAQVGDGSLANHLLGHRLLASGAHLLNIWLLWQVAGRFIGRYWSGPAGEGGKHAMSRSAARMMAARYGSTDEGRRTKDEGRRTKDHHEYDPDDSPNYQLRPSSFVLRLSSPLASVRARLEWREGAQIAATLVYAWNPLVIVEFGVSGHNDTLLIACVLGALWLHLEGRWRWAALLLTLGSLIKLTGLLFLLPYIWMLLWEGGQHTKHQASASRFTHHVSRLRPRIGRAVQALAIAIATWVVAFLPFWAGPQTLRAFTGNPASENYLHSIHALVRYKGAEAITMLAGNLQWPFAEGWTAASVGAWLDGPIRWVALPLFALLATGIVWRARTLPSLLVAWGWIVFAYLTVATAWFWPWYVSWLLVPIALAGVPSKDEEPGLSLPKGRRACPELAEGTKGEKQQTANVRLSSRRSARLWRAGLILCAGSMSLYTLFPVAPPPLTQYQGWTGLFIMGPPLLYLLVSGLYSALGLDRLWERQSDKSRVGGETPAPVASNL